MTQWTNAKLCDVGNPMLGVILFISRWLFNFPAGAQSQNAYVSGSFLPKCMLSSAP